MNEQVTVLIPSYNPGDYLQDALRSVLTQSYRKWRIIVVNDGSTDDSLERSRDLLQSTRATVIDNPVNLGQSRASNAGLQRVDTPWVVQLDADDWFPNHALGVLVAEAERVSPDVGVLHGNMKVYVEESSPASRIIQKRYLIKEGQQYRDRYHLLLSNASIWPRFYRTSALRRIGGWPTDDPYEGRYLEDKRILFRLIEHYRFHWIDEILYVHRRHDYNQTENKMDIYSFMTEWNVRDTLKRWGDPREPVFQTDAHGWKRVVGFTGDGGRQDRDDQPGEVSPPATTAPLFEWPSQRRNRRIRGQR